MGALQALSSFLGGGAARFCFYTLRLMATSYMAARRQHGTASSYDASERAPTSSGSGDV